MKIKFALVPSEHIIEVQGLSGKLQNAMEAGEMSLVDKTTEKLFSLADKDHSLSLSEEYWHRLIEKVRNFNKNFKSDYILSKPQLEMIIAANTTGSFTDIVKIVEFALRNDCVLLQLPYEEGG